MNISKHGQHLYQLTRLWAFNCYLIREDDGLTLIDTGLSGSAAGILAAAQEIGLPITRVTLTHAHGDHVGSLDAVCAQLPPTAEIAFTERTTRFLSGDLALDPAEPQDKLRGGFQTCTTRPTRTLTAGDKIGSLRVISAPGHTPDHIAFYDERDGSLIAGDAFQTQGGVAVAGQLRWTFPFPAMATWHKATAVETAQRLLELNPSRLAVGHGKVIENPQATMQQAIQQAAAKTNTSVGAA